MQSLIKTWNAWVFKRTFNVFDIIVLMAVSHLVDVTNNWAWMLLYIPAFGFSYRQQCQAEQHG